MTDRTGPIVLLASREVALQEIARETATPIALLRDVVEGRSANPWVSARIAGYLDSVPTSRRLIPRRRVA